MTARFKSILLVITITILTFVSSQVAFSAAPDGLGPWADSVSSSSQGLRKDGSPVLAARSDTTSALGVAENDTTDSNFFSLGFGGNIVLGFDNGISSGTISVVEATSLPYPVEKVKVEVSENGITWVDAGEISQDGSVDKPAGVSCAKYVKLTDISNKEDFSDDIADGYDVDGVQLSGEPCVTTTPTPTPTPGDCNKDCCSNITQKNATIVKTVVKSKAKTGGNSANNNTGGSNTITTGNATSNASVTVTGGSNIANSTCCAKGSTNVTISGNGANSTNTINVTNTKTLKK